VSVLENLIKTDNIGAQNNGWFELFNRVIYYGSFNFNFNSYTAQNFQITLNLRNWSSVNIVCSWRERDTRLLNCNVIGTMINTNTISFSSSVKFQGTGVISYIIIARI
jgi:putative uncharacterized protein FNV0814